VTKLNALPQILRTRRVQKSIKHRCTGLGTDVDLLAPKIVEVLLAWAAK